MRIISGFTLYYILFILEDCQSAILPSNHKNFHLLPKTCGRRPQQYSRTAYKTSIFDFPWVAIIQYEFENSSVNQMMCLGSLVSEKYVLASAHCMKDLPEGLKISGVRLGDKDTGSEVDCELTVPEQEEKCSTMYQDISVEEVTTHPEYTRASFNFDVGLIRLRLQYDRTLDNISPVCLPVNESSITLDFDGLPGVAVGYRKIEDPCRGENAMRKTYHPVLINNDCGELYENIAGGGRLEDQKLCAGVAEGADACFDLNGGLNVVVPGPSARYFLYGLPAAMATSCGVAGAPGVYTPITAHLDWILDQMRY